MTLKVKIWLRYINNKSLNSVYNWDKQHFMLVLFNILLIW